MPRIFELPWRKIRHRLAAAGFANAFLDRLIVAATSSAVSRDRQLLAASLRADRATDNSTNAFYIAADYLTALVILTTAIGFFECRAGWGLAWAWNIPVGLTAMVGMGIVQHRLAGLVHEGAHHILFKNRLLNELASDLLCMFPLFSTTSQYRVMHLGHHDYVNDWEHDPELLNLGKTRMMDRFPMPIRRFISNFYIRTLWPPVLFRYVWDNFYCITLGNAKHPYRPSSKLPPPPMIGPFRVTSVLGLGYIAAMVVVLSPAAYRLSSGMFLAAALASWLIAVLICVALPSHWFFRQIFRPVISSKTTSVMRLGYFTAIEVVVAWSRVHLGPQWAAYFYLLWVLPLFTTWPYFMLLRDLYQHANADDGKYTNSRVILAHPIAHWAMFIYGQAIHLTHHLYPTVPHYRLRKLHATLRENYPRYAAQVVECHGVVWNRTGEPTALSCVGDKPAS